MASKRRTPRERVPTPEQKKARPNYVPSREAVINRIIDERPRFRPDDVPYQDHLPFWLTIKETKERFYTAIRRTGSIKKACVKARISRALAHKWRDSDPRFAERWQSAWEACIDELEGNVLRRAIDGYEEPVFQGGEQVGTRVRHDPAIQIFMLKHNRPDKYGDRIAIDVSADEYGEQVRRVLQQQDEEARRVLQLPAGATDAKGVLRKAAVSHQPVPGGGV